MKNHDTRCTRRDVLAGSATLAGLAAVPAPLIAAANGAKHDFAPLAGSLQGGLITPEHPAYDAARHVWNGMIDRHPAAIAQCTGVADVVAAVDFARENDIPITVRGGGHNVAGKAVRDGALMIDLGQMHGIWVDADARRARAQGGTRWGAFDRETLARNLYTTGGTVSTTGVAGLTLGGGLGWLMRKHGLTCDNLAGAEVVTAGGDVLRADADQNADLFWALRGGGGNFGIVTSFDFELHEQQPVTGGMAIFAGDRTRDVLQFFREYTAELPDSVTTMAGCFLAPGEGSNPPQPMAWIAVCHTGPEDEGRRLVAPIKDFGPVQDFIGPMPYSALQTMFDDGAAPGARNYWRSAFMQDFADDVIDTMVASAAELPPPGSMMLVEHLGGAISRVDEGETAYSHRGAQFNVSILSSWTDAAADDRYSAWTRSFGDELRSFSDGGAYVNYMAGDMSGAEVKAMYDANFGRLRSVKRKYDPDNFFNSNQNIAP